VLSPSQIESLVADIGSMDRAVLRHHFRRYPARFPIDLSEDFLNSASVERLRHIFLAICLQTGRMPDGLVGLAA
jgi:hypothetical protein